MFPIEQSLQICKTSNNFKAFRPNYQVDSSVRPGSYLRTNINNNNLTQYGQLAITGFVRNIPRQTTQTVNSTKPKDLSKILSNEKFTRYLIYFITRYQCYYASPKKRVTG